MVEFVKVHQDRGGDELKAEGDVLMWSGCDGDVVERRLVMMRDRCTCGLATHVFGLLMEGLILLELFVRDLEMEDEKRTEACWWF